MDAIALLKEQHDEIEELLEELVVAEDPDDMQDLFDEAADLLAIHSAIEERFFYPAVRTKATESLIVNAWNEHREVKRALVTLLESSPGDEKFKLRCRELQEMVEEHVEEEEKKLFPKVRRILDKQKREEVGRQMLELAGELDGTSPRFNVSRELGEEAPTQHP
jgi:hemerythrin superfamily protein